jgi:hypothetical protein
MGGKWMMFEGRHQDHSNHLHQLSLITHRPQIMNNDTAAPHPQPPRSHHEHHHHSQKHHHDHHELALSVLNADTTDRWPGRSLTRGQCNC